MEQTFLEMPMGLPLCALQAHRVQEFHPTPEPLLILAFPSRSRLGANTRFTQYSPICFQSNRRYSSMSGLMEDKLFVTARGKGL